MRRHATPAIVIGAGQAGLAISHELARLGVEHVVLERGRVAERWRSERWDSLRLLTPNWMSRLPGGWRYRGPDPEGFMAVPEVIAHLDGYARSFAAPVVGGAAVRALRPTPAGYAVEAEDGTTWRARCVVIATGACDRPAVPAMAGALPASVLQVTPSEYRRPGQLPEGIGVLVVGASATGAQLAEEIHRSGRPVTLAVGNHTRLPRRWRGRDIMEWMDRAGMLDERADRVRDLAAARAQPSLQLVGRPGGADLDLGVLSRLGVRLTGRLRGIDGGSLQLADDLVESVAAAERRQRRVLARIEPWAEAEDAPRQAPPAPLDVTSCARERLDLRAAGIGAVVWATGFRRDLRWLQVPGVLDAAGEILHRGGVTPAPGLFALGLPFLRCRRSTFLDGVGADAEVLAWHLLAHLARPVTAFGRAAA